jgi:hypothetical protein
LGFGYTSPAEMTSLAASSTFISRMMTSDRGKNSRKPEVGLGVVGRKTVAISASPGSFAAISPLAAVEMKAMAQIP